MAVGLADSLSAAAPTPEPVTPAPVSSAPAVVRHIPPPGPRVRDYCTGATGRRASVSRASGVFDGTLQLRREGSALAGTWSGALGENRPVTGTWRDGYVELSFPGQWTAESGNGRPGPATVSLAGWFDDASGKGRAKVEGRADGQWTATRKP